MVDSTRQNQMIQSKYVVPATRNLLGNKHQPAVKALLDAGMQATAEQRKAVADKYLAPFFQGDVELQNLLMDEVLKIAQNQGDLDMLSAHLGGQIAETGDFNPGQFLSDISQKINRALERRKRIAEGKPLLEPTIKNEPGIGVNTRSKGVTPPAENFRDEQSGLAQEVQNFAVKTALKTTPPPPPPPPGGGSVQEEYIEEQMESAAASPIAEAVIAGATETPRQSKDRVAAQRQMQAAGEQLGETVQQGLQAASEEIIRQGAQEAAANASAAKLKKEKSTLDTLKHPVVIGGAAVGAASVGIGSILGLGISIT